MNRSLGLIFSLDRPYEGVFRAHVVSDRGDGGFRSRSFLDLELDDLRPGPADLSGVLPPDPAPLHTVTYITLSVSVIHARTLYQTTCKFFSQTNMKFYKIIPYSYQYRN